jgi:large subunit ribosomal protein L25
MRDITIEAEVRKDIGKNLSHIRREGNVPGIFYLMGEDSIPLVVSEKSLKPLIYTSETHIVNLKIGNGSAKNCILRDIQFDPVTERPIHFDFLGLRDDREITIEVPVTVVGGIPVGVKEGGIIQSFMRRLRVSCLPKFIPEHIEVNPENLKINQFIHVRDLKIENVKIMESATDTIVGVIPPTVEKEPEPAVPGEAPAEPEVIAVKGKKLDEEEAAAAAATGDKKGDAAKAPAAGAKPAPGAKPEAGAKPAGKPEKK